MEIPTLHNIKREMKKTRRKRENVKVVYISSPVKVKTSASGFRATVQELTGRHSDISRLVEADGAYNYDSHDTVFEVKGSGFRCRSAAAATTPNSVDTGDSTVLSGEAHRESPTSSECFLEFLDDALVASHPVHDGAPAMFPFSTSSFEPSMFEFDVLAPLYPPSAATAI